jgi:hypothetical protein
MSQTTNQVWWFNPMAIATTQPPCGAAAIFPRNHDGYATSAASRRGSGATRFCHLGSGGSVTTLDGASVA